MDKPFYNLLINSSSSKVYGSAWQGDHVAYRLIVWMIGWNAFVLNVEDYTEGKTIYRMYYNDSYEALERLLNYFGLPVDSDRWRELV